MCVCVCLFFRGARYSLLAYTSLGLDEAEGSFQSHSLIILQDGTSKSNHRQLLPILYGMFLFVCIYVLLVVLLLS